MNGSETMATVTNRNKYLLLNLLTLFLIIGFLFCILCCEPEVIAEDKSQAEKIEKNISDIKKINKQVKEVIADVHKKNHEKYSDADACSIADSWNKHLDSYRRGKSSD